MFFGALALALLGVNTKGDKRGAVLHRGNWAAKLAAWAVFCVLPFLMPNGVLDAYAWAARVGSGVFLVIQMIILLDFAATWNEAWVAAGEEDERWFYALLGLTVAAYGGVLALAGLLYAFFKPAGAGSCSLNVALITLALLLCVGFSALSVAPFARNGSLFPSAVTSLYVMYLTYSALTSEPRDYACNGLAARVNAASGGTLAAGMALTLLSVVYSALRAGGWGRGPAGPRSGLQTCIAGGLFARGARPVRVHVFDQGYRRAGSQQPLPGAHGIPFSPQPLPNMHPPTPRRLQYPAVHAGGRR
jgi:hypothetical protein